MTHIGEKIYTKNILTLTKIESTVHSTSLLWLLFLYLDNHVQDGIILRFLFLFISLAWFFSIIKFFPSITRYYFSSLRKSINPIRWVSYCLESTNYSILLALVIGYSSISKLTLLALLNCCIVLSGACIELFYNNRKMARLFMQFGFLLSVVMWVILGYHYFNNFADLSNSVTSFVTISLFWINFFLHTSFAVNITLYLTSFRKWKNYYFVERNYILLSIFSKSFMFLVILAGLLFII